MGKIKGTINKIKEKNKELDKIMKQLEPKTKKVKGGYPGFRKGTRNK